MRKVKERERSVLAAEDASVFTGLRGLVVSWYDSRLGCERSRIRSPARPLAALYPPYGQ